MQAQLQKKKNFFILYIILAAADFFIRFLILSCISYLQGLRLLNFLNILEDQFFTCCRLLHLFSFQKKLQKLKMWRNS